MQGKKADITIIDEVKEPKVSGLLEAATISHDGKDEVEKTAEQVFYEMIYRQSKVKGRSYNQVIKRLTPGYEEGKQPRKRKPSPSKTEHLRQAKADRATHHEESN